VQSVSSTEESHVIYMGCGVPFVTMAVLLKQSNAPLSWYFKRRVLFMKRKELHGTRIGV